MVVSSSCDLAGCEQQQLRLFHLLVKQFWGKHFVLQQTHEMVLIPSAASQRLIKSSQVPGHWAVWARVGESGRRADNAQGQRGRLPSQATHCQHSAAQRHSSGEDAGLRRRQREEPALGRCGVSAHSHCVTLPCAVNAHSLCVYAEISLICWICWICCKLTVYR